MKKRKRRILGKTIIEKIQIGMLILAIFGFTENAFSQNSESDGSLFLVFGAGGIISEVLVKPGDTVSSGQLLAKLGEGYYAAAVKAAESKMHFTEQEVQEAERELQRDQLLYDEGSLSGVELENTKLQLLHKSQGWLGAKAAYLKAKSALGMSRIVAPADGVVEQVNIAPGMNIVPGSEVSHGISLGRN